MLRSVSSTLRQPLIRLLLTHGLAGATAAVVAVAGLVILDVGGLGSLMARDETPILPFAMVLGAFMLTLSSAAMGAAVMRIGSEDEGRGRPGGLVPVRRPVVRRDR